MNPSALHRLIKRTAKYLAARLLPVSDEDELHGRLNQVIAPGWGGAGAFVERLAEEFFGEVDLPTPDELAEFIGRDVEFSECVRLKEEATLRGSPFLIAPLQSMANQSPWPVADIATLGDLCDWLGLRLSELEWLAGLKDSSRRLSGASEKSWNYYYRFIPKRQGPPRFLESPKPLLKSVQRKILHGIVDQIPLHEAAHGFRKNCSIRSFAEGHCAKSAVLRIDLADFFPSIKFRRISAVFRCAGYEDDVARILAGLCSHAPPHRVLEKGSLSPGSVEMLKHRHLPQGAPSSPALSNVVAFRLDQRLSGLAKSEGLCYTRYADDLAFSGGREFSRYAKNYEALVYRIVLEEGFLPNFRKSQIMRAGARQKIAGVIVNKHPNTARATYDELKAILHRCRTQGIAARREIEMDEARFAAYLRGRISALAHLNPLKGEKLMADFERIEW